MTYQIAIQSLESLYNDFKSYFDDGKIIVTGSIYYNYLDSSYGSEYNDVDIVIDERPEYDYILNEIHDFYTNQNSEFGGFTKDFGDGLIGCVGILKYINDASLYDYVMVDMFRGDFSQNLPLVEIIPGVFSQALPDQKFVEVFQDLTLKDPSSGKFQNLLSFFQSRVNS